MKPILLLDPAHGCYEIMGGRRLVFQGPWIIFVDKINPFFRKTAFLSKYLDSLVSVVVHSVFSDSIPSIYSSFHYVEDIGMVAVNNCILNYVKNKTTDILSVKPLEGKILRKFSFDGVPSFNVYKSQLFEIAPTEEVALQKRKEIERSLREKGLYGVRIFLHSGGSPTTRGMDIYFCRDEISSLVASLGDILRSKGFFVKSIKKSSMVRKYEGEFPLILIYLFSHFSWGEIKSFFSKITDFSEALIEFLRCLKTEEVRL